MQPYIVFKPSTETYGTTITSTTAQLTVPDGATKGLIQVELQDVRITFDGSVPTQTRGLLLKAAAAAFPGIYVFDGYDKLKAAKMIRGAATDATINALFEKPE